MSSWKRALWCGLFLTHGEGQSAKPCPAQAALTRSPQPVPGGGGVSAGRAGDPQGTGRMVPKGGRLPLALSSLEPGSSGSSCFGSRGQWAPDAMEGLSLRKTVSGRGRCASLLTGILPQAPWWPWHRCGPCLLRILHSPRCPQEGRSASHAAAGAAPRKASTKMSQAEAIPGALRSCSQRHGSRPHAAAPCAQPQTRLFCRRRMCAPLSRSQAHWEGHFTPSRPVSVSPVAKGCPHTFPLESLPWPHFLGGQPDTACHAPRPGPWTWPQEPGDSCLSSAALEILSEMPLWLRGPCSCDPRWDDMKSESASPSGRTQPASSQAGCLSANPPSAIYHVPGAVQGHRGSTRDGVGQPWEMHPFRLQCHQHITCRQCV